MPTPFPAPPTPSGGTPALAPPATGPSGPLGRYLASLGPTGGACPVCLGLPRVWARPGVLTLLGQGADAEIVWGCPEFVMLTGVGEVGADGQPTGRDWPDVEAAERYVRDHPEAFRPWASLRPYRGHDGAWR